MGALTAVGETHYRFPPATAYALNRCLYRLKSDDAFRARFLADPDAAMKEAGLDERERAALAAWDRQALAGLGAHAYLVFMGELRVRMAGGGAKLEYF